MRSRVKLWRPQRSTRSGDRYVFVPISIVRSFFASGGMFGITEGDGDEEDDFFKEFRLDDLDTPPCQPSLQNELPTSNPKGSVRTKE